MLLFPDSYGQNLVSQLEINITGGEIIGRI